LLHLAAATAALGFVTSQGSPIAFIRDQGAKIPGAKTFGTPAAIGLASLAVDRFVKPNKWLKLLGYAGVVLAAVKIGTDGTGFKFIGDESSSGDFHLSDALDGDDMSDLDDLEDVDGDE
jgi:hypothetical protein